LYLEVGGKRTQKVAGTDSFHGKLMDLWDFDLDPATYGKSVVLPFVQGEDGLWDGDPARVVGEQFRPHAGLVPSEYQDSGGTSWGADLAALGAEVQTRYGRVVRMLLAVAK